MKVMVNLLSSSSGGALSYVRNLIPLLVQRFADDPTHQLVLLLYNKHCEEIGVIPDSVNLLKIDRELGGAKRVLWEMIAVPKLVKEHGADVFYTPYQLAPKVNGVKTVSMIRNMEAFLFGRYSYDVKNYLRNVVLRFSSIRTLKRSDRIIAVSGFAEDQCTIDLKINAQKVIKIYHGRDTRFTQQPQAHDDATRQELGITGDYIFTCGSILPYRRVEYIIDAFSAWEGAKNCQLVIAGSGNDRRYRALIDEKISGSAVGDKILRVGHVTPEAMRVLYRQCRLFVTTTDIEACPNMGIEALSSGCNIVSSDNSPMPEIFNSAATYVASDDLKSLGVALQASYHSVAAQKGVVNDKALERAGHFCWARCADQTFDVLTHWE